MNGSDISTKEYRVIFHPAWSLAETPAIFEQEYSTHLEAEISLDAIANYTLLLHESSLMPDYSNTGWVENLIGGEWIEVDGSGDINS